MLEETKSPLNAGQQKAAEGFFEFLLGNQKELIISGPGGVGKTFLMGHLIDTIIPHYLEICKMMGLNAIYNSVQMTATTNKAAEVLGKATGRPTSTIHSLLRLRIQDDWNTGATKLVKGRDWEVHSNKILFIDEASMIDGALLNMIHEGTINCKIVYVGDHCQLAPITEVLSPIYRMNLPFYELTEPMRNSEQPALMAVCNQLRQTVETQQFKPIRVVPGVIDYLDGDQMEKAVNTAFLNPENPYRMLCYTNRRAVDYNNHIRGIRNYGEFFEEGEMVVNNSAVFVNGIMMSVENEYEIVEVGESQHVEIDYETFLEVRKCTLRGVHNTVCPLIPVSREHFESLVKYFAKQKNWVKYFHLKNNFPDLRPKDAATVHKAQGSTYDTVFIDLEDVSACRNPSQAARLLYVAFTRARQRVVLYGRLAPKYGGIVI